MRVVRRWQRLTIEVVNAPLIPGDTQGQSGQSFEHMMEL